MCIYVYIYIYIEREGYIYVFPLCRLLQRCTYNDANVVATPTGVCEINTHPKRNSPQNSAETILYSTILYCTILYYSNVLNYIINVKIQSRKIPCSLMAVLCAAAVPSNPPLRSACEPQDGCPEIPGFLGPVDCDHCNCNHKLLQSLFWNRLKFTRLSKQSAVTVVVVTICWSYEGWLSRDSRIVIPYTTRLLTLVVAGTVCCLLTRRSLLWSEWSMHCVVLWRPEALDCRVLIPPETWSGLTRNPPSLGFEPQTSCI